MKNLSDFKLEYTKQKPLLCLSFFTMCFIPKNFRKSGSDPFLGAILGKCQILIVFFQKSFKGNFFSFFLDQGLGKGIWDIIVRFGTKTSILNEMRAIWAWPLRFNGNWGSKTKILGNILSD